MSLEIGDLIQDKYRIVRLIGQGGMGSVYEGLNQSIARRVAIKVLHGGLASQAGVVERFEREAQAAGRIGNDHILEVLDMGRLADGDRFMVMEYLDGETLEERVERRGAISPAELYPIARQLLVGLAAAHNAGIIHRDLKPDNVFVMKEKAGHQDFIKIIDFGISKFTSLTNDMKMTATGAVMGTPYFMSPEQAKGSRDADGRSDLYAVGVILYKSATGQVPFDATTFNELLFKIVLSETPRLSQIIPDIDPGFESLVLRAMARDTAQRFQSAQEFIAALDNWAATGAVHSLLPAEATQAHPAYANFNGTGSNLAFDAAPASVVAPPTGTMGGARTALGVSPATGHQLASGTNVGFGNLTSGLHTNVQGSVTHGTWSNSGLSVPKRSNTPYLLAGAAGILVLGTVIGVFTLRDTGNASPALSGPIAISTAPVTTPAKALLPAAPFVVSAVAPPTPAPPPILPAPVVPAVAVAPVAIAPARETRPADPPRQASLRTDNRKAASRPAPPPASRPQPAAVAPAAKPARPRKQQDDWGY